MLRQKSKTQHLIPVISNPPVRLSSPLYTRTYIREPPFRYYDVRFDLAITVVHDLAWSNLLVGNQKNTQFIRSSRDYGKFLRVGSAVPPAKL